MRIRILRTLARRYQDVLLAAALVVMGVVEIVLSTNSLGDKLLIAPLTVVGTATLAWRRRAPVVVLAIVVATGFVSWLVVPPSGDDSLAGGIALVVALYSVGAHAVGRAAVAGALGAVAAVLVAVAGDPEEATFGGYLFFAAVVAGPWLAGVGVRRLREQAHRLEGRAVAAEREREARARAAVAEERARVARELHDIVAHAISVIVLQARGGRHALGADVAEARGAFDTIESNASVALAEMRRLLGLLRRNDDELALAPVPSLRNLDALLAEVRDAGLPVHLDVEGEPVDLSPGIDLSAYRIVQEALTNALKHAGPARARVVVRYGAADLELEISDDGSSPPTAEENGGGHGLVGMRERVSVYGGDLEAGRRPEGGYALRARLPLAAVRP